MSEHPNPKYLTQQLKETEKQIKHYVSMYSSTKYEPIKAKAIAKIEQLSIIRKQWKQQLQKATK